MQIQRSLVTELIEIHEQMVGLPEKARRAGQILTELKASIPHGQWLSWLKDNVPFSEKTAQNYMRVFDRWDDIGKSETVADLTEVYGLLIDRKVKKVKKSTKSTPKPPVIDISTTEGPPTATGNSPPIEQPKPAPPNSLTAAQISKARRDYPDYARTHASGVFHPGTVDEFCNYLLHLIGDKPEAPVFVKPKPTSVFTSLRH